MSLSVGASMKGAVFEDEGFDCSLTNSLIASANG